MSLPEDKLVYGGRPPRMSGKGYSKFDEPANIVGFWLFNRPTGATDEQALRAGMRNRVKNAPNGPLDNYFPYDLPTVHDDYWTFSGTSPLLTPLMETSNLTAITLSRVPTSVKGNLGANSNARAQPIGSHGNAAQRGFALEYNSTGQVRTTTYKDNGGSPSGQSVYCTVNVGEHDQWRIHQVSLTPTTVGMSNRSGDGIINDPTPATLTGGHVNGLQRIAIGSRIALGSNPVLPYTVPVDVALVMIVSGTWTAPVEATMLAQVKRQIRLMPTITEGSV